MNYGFYYNLLFTIFFLLIYFKPYHYCTSKDCNLFLTENVTKAQRSYLTQDHGQMLVQSPQQSLPSGICDLGLPRRAGPPCCLHSLTCPMLFLWRHSFSLCAQIQGRYHFIQEGLMIPRFKNNIFTLYWFYVYIQLCILLNL